MGYDPYSSEQDCMIYAAFATANAIGKPKPYKAIKNLAARRGWWTPVGGFRFKYLDDLFKALKIKGVPVKPGTPPKKLREHVRSGKPIVLIVKHNDWPMSHAIIGVPGTKGVKILNPAPYYSTWRRICKGMNKGKIKVAAWSTV